MSMEQFHKPHSQCNRILDLLRANDWVPLPLILNLHIASYTRRIHELRKAGFVIEIRRQQTAGVNHSQYKLVAEPSNIT